MRALVLTVLASLVISCMSPPRTRELHCLGTLMTDVSETKEAMESIKEDWRAREHRRGAVLEPWYSTSEAVVLSGGPLGVPVALMSSGVEAPSASTLEEVDILYQQLMDARARHIDAQAWYTRVARRVQTRFEEDDMLYSVLGTFVAAPASLLFYPIVRWNVRSVLWDGVDPDAADDPIQQFCLTRLDDRTP